MKTLSATPYLLPSSDTVVDQDWTGPDGRDLPERLDHWDPFTDTEVFRSIDVDLDAVRRDCALPADAAFAITASWASSRTRLSESSPTLELGTLDGIVRVSLALTIRGALAGGRVELRTSLILRYPGTDASPISPKREGAVLWTDSRRLAVEGSSARFPVSAVDFNTTHGIPSGAAWKLEWNSADLDGPVLGDLRLLINSDNPDLLASLRSGANDPRSIVIRSFVMFDVARTLVSGALANDQFVHEPERFDDGSIGRMLFELLGMCWPGVPIKTLASRAKEDPARLEAELQAHFQVLR